MNTDRYTKAVLTVIAACLLWMCVMGAPGAVQAQQTTRELGPWADRVQPVVIVGTGSMDSQGKVVVNFSQEGGRRTEPTVPVWMPYTPTKPLPVSVTNTPANPLPTQVLNVAPLPVEISPVKGQDSGSRSASASKQGRRAAKPGGGGQ